MASTEFKGTAVHTYNNLPEVGSTAPDFCLTKMDLSDVSIEDFAGSNVVMNIFPSVDTGVCAASVHKFNEAAAELKGTKVLCISRDLPFAQKRFCGAEGIDNVIMLSDLRDGSFGETYGIEMIDGPLAGLLARSVIVLDCHGKIIHSQLVPEITEEPDYDAALESLMALKQ